VEKLFYESRIRVNGKKILKKSAQVNHRCIILVRRAFYEETCLKCFYTVSVTFYNVSLQLHVGDEVDVIRGLSPMNPEFLLVSRIEILSVKAGEENIVVKLRRLKSLIVENYSEPWKESADAT